MHFTFSLTLLTRLFFFLATPPLEDIYSDMVIPNNTPLNYTFPLSKLPVTNAPGGTYKVIDTRLFPASTTICAAEVIVEVGGMRYVYFIDVYPNISLIDSFSENST
jgi:hypothetical protein